MARITVTGVPGATGEAIRRTLEERATLDTAVAGTGEQPQKPFLEVAQSRMGRRRRGPQGGVPRHPGGRPPGRPAASS